MPADRSRKWTSWMAALWLGLALGACQSPTPLAVTDVATLPGRPIRVDSVSLITLARNPAAFDDNFVQVAGLYRPLPLLVCAGETHRTPATWAIVSSDLEILAAGFDPALRELAPPGLSLIVEGRWRSWEGPVGCGRRVPTVQIWYLEVTRILSPNPLFPEAEALAEVTAGATQTPAVAGPPTRSPVPQATATRAPTSTAPVATPRPSATPPQQQTAAAGTPTVTGTATTTSAASPTGTLTPAGTTTGTATAAAEPADQGTLLYDRLVKRSLGAGTAHAWSFSAADGEETTISVAPASGLDVIVALVDADGNEMAAADDLPAGQPETIGPETLAAGDYRIVLLSVEATHGAYALTLLNAGSEPFYIFRDIMLYESTVVGALLSGVDELWSFEGQQGEAITVKLTPGSDADAVLYLLGPTGEELRNVDDHFKGVAEELVNVILPATGFYTIGAGESAFGPMSYTLELHLIS